MHPSLSTLLELATRLAGTRQEETERLAELLVATPDQGSWNSTLNNDGSPAQVCVTMAQARSQLAVRLIADPAAGIPNIEDRYERADRVLRQLAVSHGQEMQSLCDSLVENMLPADGAGRATLPGAGVWIATNLSGKGLALYATAKWEAVEKRWARARRWLNDILPETAAADSVLDSLSPRTVLVSAGVEGATRRSASAKLYWRIEGPTPLVALGIPLIANPMVSEFLCVVIQDRIIPRKGILVSVGFHVGSGCVTGVKFDVCGHCVKRTPSDWSHLLQRWAACHELSRLHVDYSALLEAAELAFVGLGLDAEAKPRLNIYLKSLRP
jgi:hypothetical protein